MNRKAQESFSFIVAIIGALIIFIIISPMINYDINTARTVTQYLSAGELLEKIGSAITRTYLSGNGTIEYLSLYSEHEFNITIVPKYIVIDFYNKSKTRHVIVDSISEKTISQGNYLIKNQEGFVNVTKI